MHHVTFGIRKCSNRSKKVCAYTCVESLPLLQERRKRCTGIFQSVALLQLRLYRDFPIRCPIPLTHACFFNGMHTELFRLVVAHDNKSPQIRWTYYCNSTGIRCTYGDNQPEKFCIACKCKKKTKQKANARKVSKTSPIAGLFLDPSAHMLKIWSCKNSAIRCKAWFVNACVMLILPFSKFLQCKAWCASSVTSCTMFCGCELYAYRHA